MFPWPGGKIKSDGLRRAGLVRRVFGLGTRTGMCALAAGLAGCVFRFACRIDIGVAVTGFLKLSTSTGTSDTLGVYLAV